MVRFPPAARLRVRVPAQALALAWSRLLLALATLAACSVAAAAPSRSLEDLTSPEVADAVRHGTTTILVPIGGTEQNGPHMTLGKHNARVLALAGRIAGALGNALVAPVIAYVPEGRSDPPERHMRFAGTISVPEAAFEQVLEGAARSFRAHGFRAIVVLGDHGDDLRGQAAVAARLNAEWRRSGVRVHALPEYYRASTDGVAALLRERGYTEREIGVHAGLADTALTLALAPADVRADALANAHAAPGVRGDPRRATAALGEAGAELIVSRSVAAIRAATQR
jgi:creatinine amidohydrolase/Fe(II)-dependent formamide hydrolase-like protein